MESNTFTEKVERFLKYQGLEFTEQDWKARVTVHGVEYLVRRLGNSIWMVSGSSERTMLYGSDELIEFFYLRVQGR